MCVQPFSLRPEIKFISLKVNKKQKNCCDNFAPVANSTAKFELKDAANSRKIEKHERNEQNSFFVSISDLF